MIDNVIEMMALEQMQPTPGSIAPSAAEILKTAQNIHRFDFVVPIVIDEENRILTGYDSFEAAKLLKMTTVPCLRVRHLSADQKRAYVLADSTPELRAARPDYEVGFGRPPVATQYKAGTSGNPKGRPKGARNKPPALNEERLSPRGSLPHCRGERRKAGD